MALAGLGTCPLVFFRIFYWPVGRCQTKDACAVSFRFLEIFCAMAEQDRERSCRLRWFRQVLARGSRGL